ncbi:hypothetical protein [Georgenia alba]|uniref:PIN domain-containing protein n=1 Tax=Georgenia alba TaxID=2233858 RepID=A0ABW2QBZ3_9MICO
MELARLGVRLGRDREDLDRALADIHLGAAMILAGDAVDEDAVGEIVTYDDRLAAAAAALGFAVARPRAQ